MHSRTGWRSLKSPVASWSVDWICPARRAVGASVVALEEATMPSAAAALAAAAAALVVDHDVIGTLTAMVSDCAQVVDAQAAGVMVFDGDGPLEVLVSIPQGG